MLSSWRRLDDGYTTVFIRSFVHSTYYVMFIILGTACSLHHKTQDGACERALRGLQAFGHCIYNMYNREKLIEKKKYVHSLRACVAALLYKFVYLSIYTVYYCEVADELLLLIFFFFIEVDLPIRWRVCEMNTQLLYALVEVSEKRTNRGKIWTINFEYTSIFIWNNSFFFFRFVQLVLHQLGLYNHIQAERSFNITWISSPCYKICQVSTMSILYIHCKKLKNFVEKVLVFCTHQRIYNRKAVLSSNFKYKS